MVPEFHMLHYQTAELQNDKIKLGQESKITAVTKKSKKTWSHLCSMPNFSQIYQAVQEKKLGLSLLLHHEIESMALSLSSPKRKNLLPLRVDLY